MLEQIRKAGCYLPEERILCQHCEAAVGGGFQDDGSVVLCSNHLLSQVVFFFRVLKAYLYHILTSICAGSR
jgi:hypothetical protein